MDFWNVRRETFVSEPVKDSIPDSNGNDNTVKRFKLTVILNKKLD